MNKIKYDIDGKYDPSNLPFYSGNSQILDFIPEKANVFEVGCSTGYLLEYLKEERNCQTLGLECIEEAVKSAARKNLHVIHGSIEERDFVQKVKEKYFPEEGFDFVIASNVLEHLVEPEQGLENLKKLLNENGYLIIALPNVAHISIRLNLFLGKFQYGQTGILDEDHLRFFTYYSAKDLIEKCGFSVIKSSIDPGGIPLVGKIFTNCPQWIHKAGFELMSYLPNLFALQSIYFCKKNK